MNNVLDSRPSSPSIRTPQPQLLLDVNITYRLSICQNKKHKEKKNKVLIITVNFTIFRALHIALYSPKSGGDGVLVVLRNPNRIFPRQRAGGFRQTAVDNFLRHKRVRKSQRTVFFYDKLFYMVKRHETQNARQSHRRRLFVPWVRVVGMYFVIGSA